MRRIAPALVIAAIGLLSPSEIQAKIYTMMDAKTPGYAAPAKPRWGLCHRKAQACATYATVGPAQHVESMVYPCPPDQPLSAPGFDKGRRSSPIHRHADSLRRRIHHEPPHCAQCYATGILCSCCDHPENPLYPGTPKYMFYKALIRTGMVVTF